MGYVTTGWPSKYVFQVGEVVRSRALRRGSGAYRRKGKITIKQTCRRGTLTIVGLLRIQGGTVCRRVTTGFFALLGAVYVSHVEPKITSSGPLISVIERDTKATCMKTLIGDLYALFMLLMPISLSPSPRPSSHCGLLYHLVCETLRSAEILELL